VSILRDLVEPDFVSLASPTDSIIVVDNASTDGAANLIRGWYSQVVLIANDSNRGFAEGSNVGISYFLDQEFDQMHLLNADAVFERHQHLCELERAE